MSERSRSRWVCLDVGETLIEETRIWSAWADVLGIPRMTFLAGFGAIVERGQEYRHVFELFGIHDRRARIPEVDAIVGDLAEGDLYPMPSRGSPAFGRADTEWRSWATSRRAVIPSCGRSGSSRTRWR